MKIKIYFNDKGIMTIWFIKEKLVLELRLPLFIWRTEGRDRRKGKDRRQNK